MWNAYKTQNAALIGRDARFNDLQVDGDFVLNSSPVGTWTSISCVTTSEIGATSNITCRYSKIGKTINLLIPSITETIGIPITNFRTIGLPAAIKPDSTSGVQTVQPIPTKNNSIDTIGVAVINSTSEMQIFLKPDRSAPAGTSQVFQCIITYIGE